MAPTTAPTGPTAAKKSTNRSRSKMTRLRDKEADEPLTVATLRGLFKITGTGDHDDRNG